MCKIMMRSKREARDVVKDAEVFKSNDTVLKKG